MFPNQSLINFLTLFYNMLDLGFNDKRALEQTYYYSSDTVLYYERIIDDLNQGKSLYDAINNLLHRYSNIECLSQSIALKPWLNVKIDELKQKRRTVLMVIKIVAWPVVFIILTLLINYVIVITLIPQLKMMLDQLNVSIPIWVTFIYVISDFIQIHWFTFCIGFVVFPVLCFIPLKSLFIRFVRPIRINFLVKEVLEIIRSLYNQGVSLKDIASSLSVHHQQDFSKRLDSFQYFILEDHSYQKAFHVLLQDDYHEMVIIQGISTNQVDSALTYIITFYHDTFMNRLMLGAKVCHVLMIVFTALMICLGFYLTLQPLMQLIQHAL